MARFLNIRKKLLWLGCVFACPSACFAATSVTCCDGLITFNFAEDYTVGQFANGDYWVHNNGNPVVITSITPVSKDNGSGRIINGTMQDPLLSNGNLIGYDSSPRDMTWEATLNVDPGYTGNYLTVTPPSSIIKAISTASAAGRPIISDAAVLTVLQQSPAAGSFRPAYAGTDKTILATVDDLDFSRLGHWAKIGGEPDLDDIATRYERVWLEHCTEWIARDIHPANNMPAYGRDMALSLASGLLYLQLDFSDDEKRELLINMVQYGLDLYGVARDGGIWYNNGGHNLGRKLPLLLAGWVLKNDDILTWADKEQHFIFQDDQQYFYVSQDDVDMTHSSKWAPDSRADPIPYEVDDIGMAEWGIRHADKPEGDNRNWEATYRDVNGPAHLKHMLAAHLMGVEDVWNWPPAFDYAERFFEIEKDDSTMVNSYILDLYEAYWDQERDDISSTSTILNMLPAVMAGNNSK